MRTKEQILKAINTIEVARLVAEDDVIHGKLSAAVAALYWAIDSEWQASGDFENLLMELSIDVTGEPE